MWTIHLRYLITKRFETQQDTPEQKETPTHIRRATLLNMSQGISEACRPERPAGMSTKRQKIVICIAGLTACGKSTAARRLAKKFSLKYASGGNALKEAALKMGYKASNRGWWESAEGMRFLEYRVRDPKLDRQIDDYLLKLAERGDIVLDSWTMPWLSHRGFKIWLEVSAEERARRLSGRDGISNEGAKRVIEEKDGRTKQIYDRLYGFKLGEDYSPFDLILDSERLSTDEVFDVLCFVVERLVLKQSR
jgi:cytidylate kinase